MCGAWNPMSWKLICFQPFFIPFFLSWKVETVDITCWVKKARTQTHLSFLWSCTDSHNTALKQQWPWVCTSMLASARVSCQQDCRPNTPWHNYYRKRRGVNRGVCVQGWSATHTTLDDRHENKHACTHRLMPPCTLCLYAVCECV